MIDFLISYNVDTLELKFINMPDNWFEIKSSGCSLKLWGDPIEHEKFDLTDSTEEKEVIEKISGHFYYLLFNEKKNTLSVGNSVFGILPLYYSILEKVTFFSNSPLSVADKVGSKIISKRFVLENILFNYQLFNHSCFEGISLTPVNSCHKLEKGKTEIKKLLQIEDYFVSKPTPWRKSVEDISKYFLERVKYYLPDELYVSALTGGFDSRTLVAASVYHQKKFKVYSFGSEESIDVNIPKQLAKVADKDYLHILLDSAYVKSKSLDSGLNFVSNSYGSASFGRAHYLYAASELKKISNYIITGNFGSELFRTAHVASVVTGKNLYDLFNSANVESAIEKIRASDEWDALNKTEFEREWNELVEDLKTLPCFNNKHKHLTKNEQFYIVIFNEVFRKYFGAEIMNQYKLIVNRTPFLDFQFVKEVLKTEIAGVYSDFFTHNPIKRFKGQVVYAHIINKAFPSLGNVETDKGYKPNDLLSVWGKLLITATFIKKKFKKTKSNDEYSVDAAFDLNRGVFAREIKGHPFFRTEFIEQGLKKKYKNKHSFFIALSQLWWVNYLEKKYVARN